MADFVTIANLAASALGEDDQLSSPDDDTHLSRSVAAVWDVERRAALRDHSWNFAMRRQALPASALRDQDPHPYGFAYRLPADCLRLIEVAGFRRGDYQMEGGFVLSDATAPLRIRYIVDVVEPARWDDLFVKAFAMRVAWQIADRITGDVNRVAIAERKYKAALSDAKRVDARENPQVQFEPTGWEQARGASHEDHRRSYVKPEPFFAAITPPAPSPSFRTQPQVQSDGTPQVGEQLVGQDADVLNLGGALLTRAWLSGETVLSTSAAYTFTKVGTFQFRNQIVLAGVVLASVSASVTVSSATPSYMTDFRNPANLVYIGAVL